MISHRWWVAKLANDGLLKLGDDGLGFVLWCDCGGVDLVVAVRYVLRFACFDRGWSRFCSTTVCVCVCFGGILVRVLLNNCLGFDRGWLFYFIYLFFGGILVGSGQWWHCRVVYVQVWLVRKNQKLEFAIILKIVFELQLVRKPKSLSLAWLGLTWLIS